MVRSEANRRSAILKFKTLGEVPVGIVVRMRDGSMGRLFVLMEGWLDIFIERVFDI